MRSNFPHLLDKPFSIEIVPSSYSDKLTSDPSDAMVVRIIDKKLSEKQKHHFYYGSQDSIDGEFKGEYMDILLWEKHINAKKITLSIMFKIISHDMFIELFVFSTSNKLQRQKIRKDLNLAKNLLHQQIDLFYPSKLNLSMNSLNNNINNANGILPGDRVVASCSAYGGFPNHKPIFIIPDQLNVTESVYDERIFELKIYFFASINNHLENFTCKAGNTSKSINVYILHHPTTIFIEPEIDKLLEPNTTITCFVKDGYPAPEINWQFISGLENASMYYNITSNGSQLYIKSNSLIKSSWNFKCSVKGLLMITEKIISFSIAVHPSQLYLEPEIKKWLQSNSTISCFIKDEYLNPEINLQLIKGPPNASLYYNVLNNGSEIYMNTNNSPGTMWRFRCNVKTIITTTKIVNKTISFIIAKNFMKKCDEKCLNTKILELEESIERNWRMHQDINQMKIIINQTSINFQKTNKINENWKMKIENKLDLFNQTVKMLKNKSNVNALKIEENKKLQYDIDQIKLLINQSSINFQRFNRNIEDWKINVKINLDQLSETIETLKKEFDAKKKRENSIPVLLSLNKRTEQSSDFLSNRKYLRSYLAVDGDYSQNLHKDNHCTHTNSDSGAFWMVDLEHYYTISHVVIYNRVDCCQGRIAGAIIEVLSKNDEIIGECGRIYESKNIYKIKCFSMVGQKIRIRLNTNEFLTLCEVDVFGLL